ncbi:MAG TPA: GntR family transcriptional regulator [Prolixibacteraceae bacterium]|nr:GntR family transcriptional regulator [Prolixibacteraceae bacterium]
MKNLKISTRQVTLVDQVEEKLLDFFQNNDLHPGDSIPKEQELAVALGVARSVLREALSRLRMLGLIETRPRRGMILCEPSILGSMKKVINPRILGEETLCNILGFRVALEMGICGLIFQNLTQKHLDELEDIVTRGVVFENNEYTPVSEYEFHAKLYEITGNKSIMEFQEIIHPVSNFVKNKFKDFIEPVNKELAQEGRVVTHKDLLDYLKKRDRDGFRKAMESHFIPYNRLFTSIINGSQEIEPNS